METDQGKWLTRQQVAGRWNVSVDTVKRLESNLTTIKFGTCARIEKESVEKYEREHAR